MTVQLAPLFDARQFFNTVAAPQEIPTVEEEPSTLFSRFWRGTQPARRATGRLVGAVNMEQPEATNSLRNIVLAALYQRTPDNYLELLRHIQAVLQHPSRTDLDQIERIAGDLIAADIRSLCPQINQEGIDALVLLPNILRREVTETPAAQPGQPPTLTASPAASNSLHNAQGVLQGIINGYDGVIHHLSREIRSPDGAVSVLRDQITQSLVQGIQQGVEHLVPLPGRMLQGIFSPQSQQQLPPAVTDPAAPQATSAILNFGDLAARGGVLLNSMLTSAGGALSQQSAHSLATLLHYAFMKLREHVNENGADAFLLSAINPMILRLQNAMAHNSWEEITGVLSDALRFMREQQVYLQGVRLPLNPVRSHVSAIPGFLNNVNAHQNALQPPAQRSPQKVTVAMIMQQGDLLKVRSASYGPANFILKRICGLNEPDLATIYRPSSDPLETDLKSIFRRRLFEKIDRSNRHFLIKWFAKRVYDALHPLSTFYVHSMIDGMLGQAISWTQQDSASSKPKDELLIELLRNWMAVTSGAYNQVAGAPPSQSRDFGTMMEEALKMPERNGGLTQRQLYAAVGKTAIETFGPRIRWSETITRYFRAEIPAHSSLSFLNPAVKVLNLLCSYSLKAMVFVPQWLGNQVLQTGAKLALSHTSLLKDQSEQAIESLRRNTSSSYALHRMIFRQQQNALNLLQQNLLDTAVDGEGLPDRNRNIKKVEIKGLVEYALEILNKGQYRTQDRLHNYLNHRAPLRDRIVQGLEDTFLPEVIETAVGTLSVALKSITEKDEIQQMLYDGLQIANDSFDAKEPVSEEEFAALEGGIRELTDQILEAALFGAIAKELDFSNENQKRGITRFIHVLKTQTNDFSLQIHPLAQQIARGSPIPAMDLQNKICAMVGASKKYNKDRLDAQAKADGNPNFHTETKHRFNEQSRELLRYCSPLSAKLNQMKSHADQMVFFDQLLHSILLSQDIQLSLRAKLQTPTVSSEDLTFCKLQLRLLNQHLITLRRNQCPLPLCEEIQRHCQALSTTINSVETLQKADTILQEADLLFMRLQQQKLAGMGAELRNTERQLCSLLNTLPFSDQQEQLKSLVFAFMVADNLPATHAAGVQFAYVCIGIRERNRAEKNLKIASLRQIGESLQSTLLSPVQEFSHHYAENQASIQRLARELSTQVNVLNHWANDQRELQIWDLFPLDMTWVTETVKNLASDRARAKIQQVFDALCQPHNYIGFINQVALVPFLKKFGQHHLKR